jgi:polygalacturonase
VLTDLTFENIRMEEVQMPITVNMHYFCDPDGHSSYVQSQEMAPRDYRTPTVGTITLRDVECVDVKTSLVCACGLPESPIEKITLENVTASYIPEAQREPAVPIMMDGFEPVSGASLWLKNVKALSAKNVHISGENVSAPEIYGDLKPEYQDCTLNDKTL